MSNITTLEEEIKKIEKKAEEEEKKKGPTTFPIEGNVCDIPFWSYSNKRCKEKELHIKYKDGTYTTIKAPLGFLSPKFPGFLDVMLMHCQRDLFNVNYAQISVYKILQELGLNTEGGYYYKAFTTDMEKAKSMFVKTDRLTVPVKTVDKKTGKEKTTYERDYDSYYSIFDDFHIAKRRTKPSFFCFNSRFLNNLRQNYLKRLDYRFCLELDKNDEALARFLYQHILKRVGKNPYYIRGFEAFLKDVGLGYVCEKEKFRKNQDIDRTLKPALKKIQGKAFKSYKFEKGKKNIIFYNKDYDNEVLPVDVYRNLANKRRIDHKYHMEMARKHPEIYVKHVELQKKQMKYNWFEDVYDYALDRSEKKKRKKK